MRRLFQLSFLPLGLVYGLVLLALDGARDITNALKFRRAQIDSGCRLDQRTKLGQKAHVLSNCILNNVSMGSFSYIGRNSIVQNTSIGNYCSIANDVMIGTGRHPVKHFSTSPIFYRRRNTFGIQIVDEDLDFEEYGDIIIGNDVWIGASAIVTDGITIGDGAIVAAGAVVVRDVAPFTIVGGVPAREIRMRFTPEEIATMAKSQWWDLPPDQALHAMRANLEND